MTLSGVSTVLVPLLTLQEVCLHQTFHLCVRREGCWTAHRKHASGVNIPAAAHACNFLYTSAPLLV